MNIPYITPILIFVLSIILLKFFKTVIIVKLKSIAEKTKGDVDDLLIKLLEIIGWPLYIIFSFYISVRTTEFMNNIEDYVYSVLIIFTIYYAIKIVEVIIDYFLKGSSLQILTKFLKWAFWLIGGVLMLNTLGFDISALLAGLGIGGIAMALAMQNILSDIFASFSIFLDKPFKEGDFIVIGGDSGTVKKIGIKTTRIIALSGEEIVISNKELTEARVHNYKKMKKRRICFSISVVYETSKEKLIQVSSIVKQIIESIDGITFDRVSFKELADSGLVYDIVYYVEDRDYGKYADAQHKINLDLIDEFNKQGIEFAYPTHKIILDKTVV